MEDPNSSPEEVVHLIYKKIHTLLKKMEECGSGPIQASERMKYLMEATALIAAAKGYLKCEAMEQRDRLNFDGPKLQFLYNATIELMEQATQEALGKNSAGLIQRINTRFRDLVKKNEPKLRRDLQEMDSRTRRKASDASQLGKG